MAAPRTPRALLWATTTLLAAGLACTLGGGAPGSTTTPAPGAPTPAGESPTAETSDPTPTVAAPDPAATSGPFELDVTVGPGDFDLPDPAVGLAELSSYQASLTVSFNGTSGGQPEQWTETYALTVGRDPALRQLTLTRTGQTAPNLWLAELDGLVYERRGEGACTAAALDPDDAAIDRYAPAALLGPVLGAEAAGSEAVNGLDAAHYTFDERALGQVSLTTSTGAVWVAAEGGYVLKYTLTSQGGPTYFGEGLDGTLTLDYALTAPNAPAEPPLTLPADCPPGRVPVPPLADATNISDQSGLLSFDSATTLPDASAYYQADLPGRGWTALAEPALLPPDPALPTTTSLQDFSNGDLQLTVIISVREGGTHIQLVMLRPVPLTGP